MSERLNNYNNYQTDSTNDELENSQIDSVNDESEKALQNLINHLNQKEGPESTPQYQYRKTDTKDVIENPEEYIIPECLEACKTLWDKNIETLMCANYDNNDLFINIVNGGLSDENKKIFIENEGKGFTLGEEHDYPTIQVPGQTSESAADLKTLADKLKIQDVRDERFQSSEKFLEEYKYGDMPAEYTKIDERGDIHIDRQYDPERVNATLQDALMQTGKANLYVPSEDRVYESQMFLDWHNRYLEEKNKETN